MQTLDKVNNEPKDTSSLCRMLDIDVVIQNSYENARKHSSIKSIDIALKKLYTH